jgi:hypothetical protein
LLAEHLRGGAGVRPETAAPERSVATRQPANEDRRSFLDNEVIALASVKDWSAQEQSPYIRYVAPYKGFLYQRLGLDKTFVRGEGCYLVDANGTRYADFIAQFGAFRSTDRRRYSELEASGRRRCPTW